MAMDSSRFLVTQEIAVRSGVIESRYRIADGRFVLDNKDLSRIRFTTDEYISGLSGVEKVSDSVAQTLIAENGYKMGLPTQNSVVESVEEIPVEETPTTEENEVEALVVDETENENENENNEQEGEEE